MNDADQHGNLSPNANRAPGNTNTVADGLVQSHHPIQQEWAKQQVFPNGPIVHELRRRFCCRALRAPSMLKSPVCSGHSEIKTASIRMYRLSLMRPLGR
ncbi:hypothetical protein KDX20_30855 [Burkholderia cenocepacia]|nr:hypothetical protein [Burkholderia cenocepacia]